jgi:hypothetical protein
MPDYVEETMKKYTPWLEITKDIGAQECLIWSEAGVLECHPLYDNYTSP